MLAAPSPFAGPHKELTAQEFHVPEVEPLALADADRDAVEQFQDGTVALTVPVNGSGLEPGRRLCAWFEESAWQVLS